jgi:hypothetical protein
VETKLADQRGWASCSGLDGPADAMVVPADPASVVPVTEQLFESEGLHWYATCRCCCPVIACGTTQARMFRIKESMRFFEVSR